MVLVCGGCGNKDLTSFDYQNNYFQRDRVIWYASKQTNHLTINLISTQ